MEKNIYKLAEVSKEDVGVAGGKGASLGEMTRVGFPVPEGFVVSARVFDAFLKTNDLNVEIDTILRKTNPENIHSVKSSSDKIISLVLNNDVPEKIQNEIITAFDELGSEHVAVRSSATAEDSATSTWAGQLDTYLDTTKKGLLENIKRCWASLFSPRAIFYHLDERFAGEPILVAVVIQKMINSEVSGVSFSVHPVTEDEGQLLIEAGYGLGESIVSGQITPDSYVVNKNTQKIIAVNVRGQTQGLFPAEEEGVEWRAISENKREIQKLSEKEILAVAEIVHEIEKHYLFPVDVEWAKIGEKFFVIQSRPMTTLRRVSFAKEAEKRKVFLKEQGGQHSLFGVGMQYDIFKNEIKEITGFSSGEIFAVYKTSGIFDVYYEEKSLKELLFSIKRLAQDENEIEKIIEKYDKTFSGLKPYYEGEIMIDSAEELKVFYNLCLKHRTIHTIIAAVPEIKFLSEKIKSQAHDTRRRAIEYAGYHERVLSVYLKNFYPSLSKNVHLIMPDEVWQETPLETLTKKTEERLSGVAFYNGELYTNEIDECTNNLNIILKETIKKAESGELEGQPAYPGKIKGIARVIMSPEDLENVAEGEIIVSPTTTPEHISVMKRVGACITDEGGIGSHTAIISREMKKPCIVGLGIATKNIKTGDEIEVDADRGIVKIIKKKEEEGVVDNAG